MLLLCSDPAFQQKTALACDADDGQILAVGASNGVDGAEPANREGGDDHTNAPRPCIPIRCSALHALSKVSMHEPEQQYLFLS
jgi:hypothetical protein